MKGVVFNILEDFVVDNFGDEKWEEIYEMCPLQTSEPFVGPKTYPDTDLFSIVSTTCSVLGVEPAFALRAFGKYAFPRLAGKFPVFLEGFTEAKPFLLSVDGVIHVEVAKLMEGSVLPKFEYSGDNPDQLQIHYSSKRGLCHLMEGLLDGVAEHFGETITHTQSACAHEGAEHCTFDIKFEKRLAA